MSVISPPLIQLTKLYRSTVFELLVLSGISD